MRIIESLHNNLIVRYAKLTQKKYRDKERLYIIEGKKNVYDSLAMLKREEIEAILVVRHNAEEFVARYPELDENVISVEADVLERISDYTSESGIIIVARQRDFSQKIEERYCIYLDRIRDPGNLGTIIRTAVAAGYGIILDNCCEVYNPKVVRSCMSAINAARISYANKGDIEHYKQNGYYVAAATPNGRSIFSIASLGTCRPFMLMIGNEAEGIAAELMGYADDLVSIPMDELESLNAALAAGILMYEYKYRVL